MKKLIVVTFAFLSLNVNGQDCVLGQIRMGNPKAITSTEGVLYGCVKEGWVRLTKEDKTTDQITLNKVGQIVYKNDKFYVRESDGVHEFKGQ